MTRIAMVFSGSVVVALIWAGTAVAQRRSDVPGAIWEYEMSQVASPEVKRSGAFRIEGREIFQPRGRKPTKIGSLEGKKKELPQKGDRVKVAFDALRGSDDKELKCAGPILWDSFGEVHGRLVDASGLHWNFKASRVKE